MAKVNLTGLPPESRGLWFLQSGNVYVPVVCAQVADGDTLPVVNPSGESLAVKTLVGESVDVYLQDQTTPIVVYRVHQDLETVTLANPTATGDTTVVLQPGHSAAAGQLLRGPAA